MYTISATNIYSCWILSKRLLGGTVGKVLLRLPDEIIYAGFFFKREDNVDGKWKVSHTGTAIPVTPEKFDNYTSAKFFIDQLIGRA